MNVPRHMKNPCRAICFALKALAIPTLVSALLMTSSRSLGQTNEQIQAELKKLSLEELMQMEVSAVSRRPEPLNEVPSGIQVITQEEIRRSGARSIPEALRIA